MAAASVNYLVQMAVNCETAWTSLDRLNRIFVGLLVAGLATSSTPFSVKRTTMIYSVAPRLKAIRDKVEAGERLSFDDGLLMYDPEISVNDLGQLANRVRETKNGNAAYYNINTHLNATNVCVYRCVFCAFRSDLRSEKSYAMNDEQILQRGQEAVENGCTEMHVVGGLHHQRKYEWYRDMIGLLHNAYPKLHLKAWTAVEVNWFEFLTKRPTADILTELRSVGMGSMPGGGAEIFHPEVRDQICEHKADGNNWLHIHRTAHQLGIRTNCTMLYGHVEKPYHRVDHLIRLRGLQDETSGFQTFIPLAFHPENTGLSHLKKPTAIDDLRNIAISRLMLDNIDHIKAYWIMLGIGTAQAALAYGADDLDGTVRHELIYHDAGATTPEFLSVDRLKNLIREAGREPVERDTLYREVIRDSAVLTDWRVGAEVPVGA